jgi:hypothetical protein
MESDTVGELIYIWLPFQNSQYDERIKRVQIEIYIRG